jgi:meromycolic acid enoyl-[acyl-carrier-protein] reductase
MEAAAKEPDDSEPDSTSPAEESAEPVPGLLEGKRLLITGVATRHSIAYSVAERAQRAGAEVVLTGFGRAIRLTRRAAEKLPEPPEVLELDVSKSEDFDALAKSLEERWGGLDGMLHAIAFAPGDALGGNFLDTPAESASMAFEVSAFSLKELARALGPLMPRGGSIVGLDFDASRAWPSYDWMGVAKAALESVNRYLARDLGPQGIRSNLVSAGPLDTPAAGGIPGFDELAGMWGERAPLGWDQKDASPVADVCCFLLSDLARCVSGQIVHADGGYSAVAG